MRVPGHAPSLTPSIRDVRVDREIRIPSAPIECQSYCTQSRIALGGPVVSIRMACWIPLCHALAAPLACEPVRTLAVDGRYVTVNGRPTFLVGHMAPGAGKTDSLDELQRIVDAMMLPFGMNLWIGGLGGIHYGAYNEVVNIERGLEREPGRHLYPWLRTGGGRTEFGGPRFDLDRWDESYFALLHQKVELLNRSGIVPVIEVFSDHAIDAPLHWRGHPFHPANNVNALGLSPDSGMPGFWTDARALGYQDGFIRRLLGCLTGTCAIVSPFGEANRTPLGYMVRWLDVLEAHRTAHPGQMLVCLSGRSEVLDACAKHPAVGLIDIYCYHDGRYDDPEVNVPDGPLGVRATVSEAWERYGRPVAKLYHKYGYPYADPSSPWADPVTGTDGGGPSTAGPDALHALAKAGGAAFFLKMAWARDRGQYLKPDAWSESIAEFLDGWAPLPENRGQVRVFVNCRKP